MTSADSATNSLNQALVDPHLICVPCFASLTTRCLTGCDLQRFCWKADRALDAQVLGFGSLNELLADFL